MVASIVDKISVSSDIDSGGEDWLLVTAPLRSALLHKVGADPMKLYVPPKQSLDRLSLALREKQRFEAIPTDRELIISSPLLNQWDTPIVLIGNAGVGKTSWIRYFLYLIEGHEGVRCIYYSQKAESGRPVFFGESATEKFRRIVFRQLVKQLHDICRSIGMGGINIFSYSLEQVENGTVNSEMEFTDALKEAIETI